MRVLLVRADEGGCAFYRMNEPARVARELGVDVEVRPWIDVEATQNVETGETNVYEVKEDVDLIVFQRPLKRYLLPTLLRAQEQGIACAVEVDDHFGAIHPKNVAHQHVNPERNPSENRDWLFKATQAADLVTVSTPTLAAFYAAHGRSRVLRNCVPASIGDVRKRSHSTPRVGWSGTVRTHPTDLFVTRGGVSKAVTENRAEMFVVGDSRNVRDQLGFPLRAPVRESGWVPLLAYYETMAENVDVGIVPLDMIEFNQAKSYLKGLEFAALGVPFVASPLDEYKLLAELGVGTLAETPGDWRKKLNVWLKDSRKRVSDGKRYRDIVLSSLTYERNAHQWIDAWAQAIQNRKSAS